MKRVYRTGSPTGYLLGGLFVILGILLALFPKTFSSSQSISPLIVAWMAICGIGLCVITYLSRVETSEQGVRQFTAFGKLNVGIAWSDVEDLVFLGRTSGRGGTYNRYSLKAKDKSMILGDNFAGWDDLRAEIFHHLGKPVEPTGTTSSGARSKMQLLAAGIFCAVWLTLFLLMSSLGGTSYRYTVDLYPAPDGWIVQYTFYNTSKFNSLNFDIERTWLNQTEADKVPPGVRVDHGQHAVLNLWFPATAAKQGQSAHLHSWWQYHTGGSGYHMQPMDHDLVPETTPAPPI
ncbi:MAG: hypothetical protein JST12_02995 [Armatimonadetes bacterium]|nr:hypothetical protein [Armatimonadota bacterium]